MDNKGVGQYGLSKLTSVEFSKERQKKVAKQL